MTDKLLDISWSLVYATIIATISYWFTNQPGHINRFIGYLLVWYLIVLVFNTISHVITLLFYPMSTVCLLLGLCVPSSTILFSNFAILKSDQSIPYKYLTPILFEHHMLNSLVLTLHGLERCPHNTVSLIIESYALNETNSLLWETLQIVMHLVIYNILCLLILIYKSDIFNLLLKIARTYFISKHVQSQNPDRNIRDIEKDNISKTSSPFKSHFSVIEENLSIHDNVTLNDNGTLMIEHGSLNSSLNIAWKNLTIKVAKTLFKCEKIILRDINGSVEFGTMMALMGPSGAGKSTLLKTLMGINRNLMTKESKIYCNQSVDMKKCFISQDVRQHIISGLTVKQSIIYASKLKNSEYEVNVDHRYITETLIKDFAIDDIINVDIGKCSSGQQKRCILAMELCSQQKPTVVCVDEPTSGLDSHSALMVRFLRL